MRKIILFVLVIIFAGCSDYNESLLVDFPSYKSLTPQGIDTSLPVINIEVDQDEFDNMYDNYLKNIHVYGFFNLYRDNDLIYENIDVRLQIKGGYSAAFPLKSLGIRFDGMICNIDRQLINPLNTLPFHNIDEIEIFRLRNSGNDFYGTMIKDISYTQLAVDEGLDIDVMYTEQAVVFINGQFSGVMNMRTEGNTRGMAGLYGVPKSRVTLGKIIPVGQVIIMDGDYERIKKFLEAIGNRNLNYLKMETDVENFIDYMIFQSYVANRDWPHNNVRFYAIDDSKFRFVMFDMDLCNTTRLSHSPLDFIYNSNPNRVTDLFDVFYSDQDFRDQFYRRYMELLDSDLSATGRFSDISVYHYQNIEEVMPYHIEKYNIPETMIEWYRNIDIVNMKFEERHKYVKKEFHQQQE